MKQWFGSPTGNLSAPPKYGERPVPTQPLNQIYLMIGKFVDIDQICNMIMVSNVRPDFNQAAPNTICLPCKSRIHAMKLACYLLLYRARRHNEKAVEQQAMLCVYPLALWIDLPIVVGSFHDL